MFRFKMKRGEKEEEEEALGPGLERDGSDDQLVVHRSQCSSDEGPDPKDPLQPKTKGCFKRAKMMLVHQEKYWRYGRLHQEKDT